MLDSAEVSVALTVMSALASCFFAVVIRALLISARIFSLSFSFPSFPSTVSSVIASDAPTPTDALLARSTAPAIVKRFIFSSEANTRSLCTPDNTMGSAVLPTTASVLLAPKFKANEPAAVSRLVPFSP